MTQPPRDIRLARGIVVAVAVVVGFNLLVLLATATTNREVVPGPQGSSFVTTDDGTAALFELYDELGLDPLQLRTPVSRFSFDRTDVLFRIDPGLGDPTEDEMATLRSFVVAGGRVVLAGSVDSDLVEGLTGVSPEPEFGSISDLARPVFSDMPAQAVAVLEGRPFRAFDDTETFVALFAADQGGFTVLRQVVGAGDVYLLSDSSYLANAWLDRADNAAFALTLAGGRRPVFDEAVHGFQGEGNLIPDQWRTAFWLGLAAVAIALVGYGWRAGPPEQEVRDLGPQRIEFVESVGALLSRSGDDTGSVVPIREAAVRLVGGSISSPSNSAVAAQSIGLSAAEAKILFAEPQPDPVEMASAFAKLHARAKESL